MNVTRRDAIKVGGYVFGLSFVFDDQGKEKGTVESIKCAKSGDTLWLRDDPPEG